MRITSRHNFLLLAFAPLLWSCATDDVATDLTEEKTEEVIEEGAYMKLQIERPGDRQPFKSPHGGQYGNAVVSGNQWSPYLKNVTYDYDLADICIFFFDTAGKSVKEFVNDGDPSTRVAFSKYITKFSDLDPEEVDKYYDKQYVTATVSLGNLTTAELRGMKMIVVGNAGNLTRDCFTLGDLRDRIAKTGYEGNDRANIYAVCPTTDKDDITVNAQHPYYFTMGLYDEPTEWIIAGKSGEFDDPYEASVTLERLSARIDFELTQFPDPICQVFDPHAPIPYPVKGKAENGSIIDEPLAKNWVTHIRLVNAVQTPSYYLRRTADGPGSTATEILGFESESGKLSTNYVIDPYTANKAAAPAGYYGNTALADVMDEDFRAEERVVSRAAYLPLNSDHLFHALPGDEGEERISAFAFDPESTKDVERENYYILGYPQENTLAHEQMTRDYATGILVRSIYEPKTVWRWKGGSAVEETNALTETVLSDGSAPSITGATVGKHYGCTFWMIEALKPNPTESDRAYFMAATEGLSDKTSEADEELIRKAVQYFKEQHPETGWTDPVEYVGGVAYNYYWVRHSNSQGTGHPFSNMEYSIVRNNIYRIAISAFSGPGAPSTDPELDNPDRILPVTYVHKWHRYQVEEVNM